MKKDVPLKIQGTQKISNKKRITPKSIKDSKDPDEKIGIPQKRLKRPPIKKIHKKMQGANLRTKQPRLRFKRK
jgi:hypothetical protein